MKHLYLISRLSYSFRLLYILFLFDDNSLEIKQTCVFSTFHKNRNLGLFLKICFKSEKNT